MTEEQLDRMRTEKFIDLLFNNCNMWINMIEEVKVKDFRKLKWKLRLKLLWLKFKLVVDISILLFALFHIITFFWTEDVTHWITWIIFLIMATNDKD
jgi:phosphatidylserine synthase